MYGDIAHKLMLDAKRAQNLESISLYQDELIKGIVKESQDLNREAEILQLSANSQLSEQADRVTKCQLFVTHLCMRRNKRCLLAYQKLRAEKLDSVAWRNMDPEQDLMDNLSHNEQEYLKKYNELLVDYKSSFTDIDLSGSLDPPKDVFIDVRVLKDAGEIQTEYGVFNLTKDSQFFVRQADVERLIQQGYLQKL